ncbi:MAG: (2Fe-2S) ferredoxin domain-containing protein, partial [Clostridia bacterium]
MYRSHILVCGGTGCTSGKSREIFEAFEAEINALKLDKEVKVIMTGCFGLCALGPIVVVYPEGAFYSQVKVADAKEIIDEHIQKGRIVKRLLYKETIVGDGIKSLNETNFYKKQKRVAL